MILLHGAKGQITGQVQKNLQGEDVAMLASNINRVEGTAWQVIVKFRDTRQAFPAIFSYALCMFDAFVKEPFVIELSEAEARGKLKNWGITSSEIESLTKIIPEGD